MSETECENLYEREITERIFKCSVCGYFIDDIFDGNENADSKMASSDEYFEAIEINYCPHCGRKVVKRVMK